MVGWQQQRQEHAQNAGFQDDQMGLAIFKSFGQSMCPLVPSKPEWRAQKPQHRPLQTSGKLTGSPRASSIVSKLDEKRPFTSQFIERSLKSNRTMFARPSSPVSHLPPDTISVVSQNYPRHTSLPSASVNASQWIRPSARRPANMNSSDIDKVTTWLQNLQHQTRGFSSYCVYCETIFKESEVLTAGKPSPNRLQTAVAMHCLWKAATVFARHENILLRIARDLESAIYVDYKNMHQDSERWSALEYYVDKITFYEREGQYHLQREGLQQELHHRASKYEAKLFEKEKLLEEMRDRERLYKLTALDKIDHRNTVCEELSGKLDAVLSDFQYLHTDEKQQLVIGIINSLDAYITAETVANVASKMSEYEKEKLLTDLFRDELADLAVKIRYELEAKARMQHSAMTNGSVARISRFHNLMNVALMKEEEELNEHASDGTDHISSSDSDVSNTRQLNRLATRKMLDEAHDICDQDKKLLERIHDLVDEVDEVKRENADLRHKLEESDHLTISLRLKVNEHLNAAEKAAEDYSNERKQLQNDLDRKKSEMMNQEVQTNKSLFPGQSLPEEGLEGDVGEGESEVEEEEDLHRKRSDLKRKHGTARHESNGGLICKIKRTNKYGVGIASIIEQARVPATKVKKILSKRKPLTLNELHAVIVGYYQAKMFQDVQDDKAGKPRSNLAQFIQEMYVLHYGLKDLAISQLIFLDAAIRRYEHESARVRIFGLLTGSLDSESHACSIQGVDFFFFVVIVIFNAGVYKKGRREAVSIAQNLKVLFGDGIFLSQKAVRVKTDHVCQAVDMVFSYAANDTEDAIASLKDELQAESLKGPAASTTGNTVCGSNIDVDTALERIMVHWFALYEGQMNDIYDMFHAVDANGDGTLDFTEFEALASVLEPHLNQQEKYAMFERAAGEDLVIDKEEFVQVMLAHQRTSILKNLYNGNSNKKIVADVQHRKSAFKPTLVTKYNISGGELETIEDSNGAEGIEQNVEEDSEGFASLTAAMNEVSYQLHAESVEKVEQEKEEEEEENTDNRHRVEESVPFVALIKLSKWAKVAKSKVVHMHNQSHQMSVVHDGEHETVFNSKTESGERQ